MAVEGLEYDFVPRGVRCSILSSGVDQYLNILGDMDISSPVVCVTAWRATFGSQGAASCGYCVGKPLSSGDVDR